MGFYLLPNDTKEMAESQRLNERLIYRALALDGTCTGEHGIGCGKIDFVLAEHGEAMSVMRAIKTAIDPHNIMSWQDLPRLEQMPKFLSAFALAISILVP